MSRELQSDTPSAAQIRAARAFLGWSIAEAADRCGTSVAVIWRAEHASELLRISTAVQQLLEAYEVAGITFLQKDDQGPGVRLLDAADRRDTVAGVTGNHRDA